MKKILILSLISTCIILSGCQNGGQPEKQPEKKPEKKENLLKNGDFENNLASWAKSFWRPGGSVDLDNVETKNGKNSVRISNSAVTQYTLLQQQVPLKSNSKYRVSFFIKASDVKSTEEKKGGAALLILNDGKNIFMSGPSGVGVYTDGSFGWRNSEFEFETKKLSGPTVLYLINSYAKGSVWFDDVVLEELKITPVTAQLFPVEFQNNTYNLAADFPTVLVFQLKGKPGKKEKLTIIFELPEEIKCLGAQQWLMTETDKMKVEEIERAGKRYNRYTISVNKAFIPNVAPDKFSWAKELLYLRAKPDSAGGKAYWHILVGDYESPEKEFQINVMPELKSGENKLKNFGLLIGHPYYAWSHIPEVRETNHRFWMGLAENPYAYSGWYSWERMVPEFRKQLDNDFYKYFLVGFNYSNWKSKNPELAAKIPLKINELGKDIPTEVCPGYMAKDKDSPVWTSWVPGDIQQRIKETKNPQGIVWDFEPLTSDYCFCRQCREDFAKFAKLEKVPDAAEIGKQKAVWFDYQLAQYAKILKNFSDTVRENYPGIPVVLCTDPLKLKDGSKWCGVDIRLADQGQFDLFMNMPYYSGTRFFDDIEFNNKTLKTPNFPLIDPAEELVSFFSQYSPEKVRMNILATAVLGCKGIGFWPGDGLDGKYLQSIADGISLVSQSEKYYLGRRVDSMSQFSPENVFEREIKDGTQSITVTEPDFSSTIRSVTWEKNGNYLVALFNYDENDDLIAKVALPGLDRADYFVREINRDLIYSSADPVNGFLVEIGREDVKLIEITQNKPNASGTLEQSDIKSRLEKGRRNLKNSIIDRFPNQKSGDAEIAWGFLLPDKNSLLKLTKAETSAYINLDERASVTGLVYGKNDSLLHNGSRGFLDKLILFNNAGHSSYRYTLKKTVIEKGIPKVELFYRVPPEESANADSIVPVGLEITKTVSLEQNGKMIKTRYQLVNRNVEKKTLKINFRVSNFPRIGNAKSVSLTDISQIKYNNISIPAAGPSTRLILGKGISKYTLLPGKVMPEKWDFSPVSVTTADTAMQFVSQKDHTAGFMVWSSLDYFTIEFLSTEIELKFGEKIEYQTDLVISRIP
ncbi:MAG: hypothetical protein A2020_08155 [Lentisphaerae bacterium GWF2_45_14]|nr:MAG: hypothetical protein A2020_08155 [Lentisphaerae bacterium GWF2_45_14]